LFGSALNEQGGEISPWLGQGGIPPPPPLPPAAPVRLWRRSDPFGLDDFKFFIPLLAGLWASPSLAANY